MRLLAAAAADPMTPGSNPRVGAAASAWLLLLPDLHLRCVAIDGRIDPTTRDALQLVADVVVGMRDVRGGEVDLVVIGHGGDVTGARRWVEGGRPVYVMPGVAAGLAGDRAPLALTPRMPPREVDDPASSSTMAVPMTPLPLGALRRLHGRAQHVVHRVSVRAGRPLGAATMPDPGALAVASGSERDERRPGWLLRADGGSYRDLPPWLVATAGDAGVDLGDHRWRLVPGGEYWSQKAVFLVHRPLAEDPHLAIKVSRHPAFARRLATEQRALEHLAGRGPCGALVPEPAFTAAHRGMSVLAESAVVGTPLARLVTPAPDCPATGAALDALVELALGTDGPAAVGPGDAAAALAGVVDRFAAAHPARHDLQRFLERQVARVAASSAPFPAVFQHGDFGVWNLVMTGSGRLGILDWENAEAGGIPLWDLWYFVQTRGSRLAGARGIRYGPDEFARQLLSPSPHSELLAAEVRRWCDRSGLDRELVAPLFHLCWAHHAAKEASHTPAGRARDRGRYVRLLGRSMGAPALPFAPGPPG